MKSLYNINSLVTYNEQEIRTRNYLVDTIASEVKKILRQQNKAWQFYQIESPCLIPQSRISENYSNEDMYFIEKIDEQQLCLKPETTSASFIAAEDLLREQNVLPPLCVWQHSKSFRREQDQSFSHVRLKEFYQLEFQCIYNITTKNNYQDSCIEDIAKMFMNILHLPTRIVLSDRLPAYSLKTLDIEVKNNQKWMEVCSVSLRKDFIYPYKINNKDCEFLVLEIALGTDRLLYNLAQINEFYQLEVQNTLK